MSVPVHRSEAWLVERVARGELRHVAAALMAADELADACMDLSDDWPECRVCKAWDSPAEFTHKPECALAKYRKATS
jgi:hypothetical protein